MGRPSYSLLTWATDALYPAGANPWNNQPNKVNPGPSLAAEGFEPGQAPAAEFLNYALWNAGVFLSYLDQIDTLNWDTYLSVLCSLSGPVDRGNFVCWDFLWRRYWMVGSGPTVFYSYNAQNWVDESGALPGGATALSSVAVDLNTGFVWTCAFHAVHTYYRGTNGTWHLLDMPNCNFAVQTIWDPGGTFLHAGQDSGVHPGIWQGTETGGGLTGSISQLSIGGAATYTGTFFLIAANGAGSKRLAIAKITTPVAEYRIWYNNDLAQPWVNQGPFAFSAPPVAITCTETNTFIVVCSDGNVYASADGSLWINQSSMSGTCYANCLSVKGSTLVAVNKGTNGIYYLKSSIDDGVTWSLPIAYPHAQATTPGCLIPGDGRLSFWGINAGTIIPSVCLRSQ